MWVPPLFLLLKNLITEHYKRATRLDAVGRTGHPGVSNQEVMTSRSNILNNASVDHTRTALVSIVVKIA